MDLKQLECFVACADQKSISKAAEVLFLDQSYVSRMIKSLEDEMEVSLFVRSHKGVFLTQDGKKTYQVAQTILMHMKSLGNIREIREDEHLLISSFHSNYIANCFAQFCQNWAGRMEHLRAELIYCSMGEALEQVENFRSDICFIYSSDYQKNKLVSILNRKNLTFVPLCRALPAIYLGKRHSRYEEGQLTMREISELHFFKMDTDYTENFCDFQKTIQKYQIEKNLECAPVVNNEFGMQQMLNTTDFAYLAHYWLNKKGIPIIGNDSENYFYHMVPLESADGEIFFGYVIRKNDCPNSCIEEFLEILNLFFISRDC